MATGSLNVIETSLARATSTAPSMGTLPTTVGASSGTAAPMVVKLKA